MGLNEYIIVVGIIIVGIIFFLAIQTYVMSGTKETFEYGVQGTADRIGCVLERLSAEPSYARYCLDISLSDLKVEQGYLTFKQREESYILPVPKEVKNTDLKEIATVCFVHSPSGEISIYGEIPACDMDTICTIDECKEDCQDCYGPDSICIGDGFCNPYIGENCDTSPEDCNCSDKNPTYICCPSDLVADDFGCVNEARQNLSKSEECFCNNECNSTANLTCNPTTPTFTNYTKACCELGKSWNGTNCTSGGDVIIAALNTTLQSAYSSTQITTLENKIKNFQSALANDGLGSIFLYLDEDETSDIIGSKVMNPNSWSNIDSILDQLIPKLNSSYLIIIGGYNRFVQTPVGSSTGSDNPYGDYIIPKDNILDIPVGRIPDPNNGDLDVILNALDTSISLHNAGGLSLSDYTAPIMNCGGYDIRNWNSGKCFCSGVWGSSCSACGTCCGCIGLSSTSGNDFVMVLAHGPGPSSSDYLHGGCIDPAVHPSDFTSLDLSEAFWMSMSCGGGYLKKKSSTSGSIAMTFLKNGGALYVGSTNLNYGGLGSTCPVLGGDSCIGSLYAEVATRFSVGKRVGDAYREGKNYYFTNYHCGAGTSYHYHINCLYGDPTLKIKDMW